MAGHAGGIGKYGARDGSDIRTLCAFSPVSAGYTNILFRYRCFPAEYHIRDWGKTGDFFEI